MDERLEKYFVDSYPNLFEDYRGDMHTTCMTWGCECGNGWFNIMNDAFKKVERPGVKLVQVKEKFGGLRLYWTAEGLSEDEYKEISTILGNTEDKSYKVCEICGAPGKTSGKGWVSTLCKSCRNKMDKGSGIRRKEIADKILEKL